MTEPQSPELGPDPALLAHVQAAASLLGLRLDPARAQATARQLGVLASMVAMLDAAPLADHDEAAARYEPAPFPSLQPQAPVPAPDPAGE